MTVIVWDGKTLAADKRATDNGLARTVTKIQKLELVTEAGSEDVLVGIVGDYFDAAELLGWFQDGADPQMFPEAPTEAQGELIVISRTYGIQMYVCGPYPMTCEDARTAWGSGRDIALATMHLGHDAKKAVEVACLFDVGCGNGIDVLQLSPKPTDLVEH